MIKINFVDFWKNFNPKDNYFYNFLDKHFDVELSENPDYCFFSVYGYEHLKYNKSIKILSMSFLYSTCFTGLFIYIMM